MSLTTILLFGLGIIALLLVVGIVVTSTSESKMVEERLGRFLNEEQTKKKETTRDPSTSVISEWVNRRVEKSSWGDKLARDLARADMKFKPGEFVAFITIVTITLGGLLWFIGGKNIVSLLIGAAIGIVLPIIYLNSQKSKRLIKFDEQLPDMINLMVNGLRAGYSTMQAMEAISKELPPPICDEFRRVVQEMQIGVTMERALDNLVRRIPSADLDFVITAINVQREVGGNLAEILDIISHTIRERIRIKGEIRVMTAQVIYSGRILALVPFFIVVILWFINQEYMMEFVNNPACGGMAAGVGITMIGIGYFIMTRIADIEV
jgi:tight adherence protein B